MHYYRLVLKVGAIADMLLGLQNLMLGVVTYWFSGLDYEMGLYGLGFNVSGWAA